MKILLADDDPVVLHLLKRTLAAEYEVVTAPDGERAWEVLRSEDGPRLAVLNWRMPGLDGLEICRRARRLKRPMAFHLLLLTASADARDLHEGFAAGADDYITKPCDRQELRARLAVGRRILQLQEALCERVRELETALASVRQLQGLLPICSWCKRIRDDRNYWQQVESYVAEHSAATFTHGICPDCYRRMEEEARGARQAAKAR
jgi:DNA-binding response OmpR family regulator